MKAGFCRFKSAIIIVCLAYFWSFEAMAQQSTLQSTGWSNECLTTRVCELKSEILSDSSVAARLSVFNIRGQFFLQYTIPLGVDISRGIQLAIDNQPPVLTRLTSCTEFGCTGTADINPDFIQSMKQGIDLNVLFTGADTQDTFAISFSLSGFTASYNELVGNK